MNIKSDAEWYFNEDKNSESYYAIFFSLCKKYNLSWMTASDKEKAFIEEITRINYERKIALENGKSFLDIKPSFVA